MKEVYKGGKHAFTNAEWLDSSMVPGNGNCLVCRFALVFNIYLV